MKHIPFSNNYRDHSTERGFRFEFFCEKCRDGYMTEFQSYTIGTIKNLFGVAEGLFGGFFRKASAASRRVHSATWEHSKDGAFLKAVEEAKKHFHRCSRCGDYFCKNCWNPDEGLCIKCAPFLRQEIESAKRQTAIRQAKKKVEQADYIKEVDIEKNMQVTCPKCQSPVKKGKFCPECGTRLNTKKICMECKMEISMSAKFCPECGAKV